MGEEIVDALGGAPPTGPKEGVPPWETPVFVPAHPRYPGDGRPPRIALELLELNGRTPVPVAFTSLNALIDALGPAQPWVVLALGPFARNMREAGLPGVRLNPRGAEDAERWRAEDLRAYAERVSSE